MNSAVEPIIKQNKCEKIDNDEANRDKANEYGDSYFNAVDFLHFNIDDDQILTVIIEFWKDILSILRVLMDI